MSMSSTSAVNYLMPGFIIVATVMVVFAAVANFADRDGMIFRIASKFLFPVTQNFVSSSKPASSAPITEKLSNQPAGWTWFQSDQLATASFDENGLVMVPAKESVWWKNKRGPLFYTYHSGDFDARVSVTTRKKSNPESYPDKAYQFGGLIIRDPRGAAWLSREEYVFIAVGHRGEGLQIESKSTFGGYSDVTGLDWDTGDARLRIKRTGKKFELYARSDHQEDWGLVQTFDRELPDVVQVGLFAYAYSDGEGVVDIVAKFSDFEIRKTAPKT